MPNQTQVAPFLDGLYGKLVEDGIGYFFPSARLEPTRKGLGDGTARVSQNPDSSTLSLNWLGSQYVLKNSKPFSDSELKLLRSIGAVLDSRYRMLFDATLVEQQFDLFRGLPEDRYVLPTSTAGHMRRICGRGQIESKTSSKCFERLR